jgi:hypothetical protein
MAGGRINRRDQPRTRDGEWARMERNALPKAGRHLDDRDQLVIDRIHETIESGEQDDRIIDVLQSQRVPITREEWDGSERVRETWREWAASRYDLVYRRGGE